MLDKICRTCGAPFKGGPRAWYCPKCREERRRESNMTFKQKRKAGDYLPIGTVIKCEICGRDMIKNSGNHRYCDTCAPLHLKEVDNAQSLDWKRENPEKIRTAKRATSKRRHQEDGKQSGIKYITWNKGHQKWRVAPYVNGKRYHIGYFADIASAKEALNKFMAQNLDNKLSENGRQNE